MKRGDAGGKVAPPAARRGGGPQSLAALVPDLLRPALRRRTAASAHLAAEWESVVGPVAAAASRPRKLFAGTLSIAAGGAAAMEMQHRAPLLIERINSYLGRQAVSRLRFVQDFSTPAPPLPQPPAAAPAEAAVAHLPPGPLRDVLARLGGLLGA